MRRTGIALLVAVGITGFSISVASAGRDYSLTRFVKFEYENDGDSKPQFSGKIRAQYRVCAKGRQVKLFREKKNGDSKRVGSDIAHLVVPGARGPPGYRYRAKFQIRLSDDPPQGGKYYARAPTTRSDAPTSTARYAVCLREVSDTITIG